MGKGKRTNLVSSVQITFHRSLNGYFRIRPGKDEQKFYIDKLPRNLQDRLRDESKNFRWTGGKDCAFARYLRTAKGVYLDNGMYTAHDKTSQLLEDFVAETLGIVKKDDGREYLP